MAKPSARTPDAPATPAARVSVMPADSSRDRVLDAMLNVASHDEFQKNRRWTSVAYSIAAILVPLFSAADFLFHAVDPTWNLETILAIRLAVTPVLMIGALRLRGQHTSTREVNVWIAMAPTLLTTGMAFSVMATGMLESPYVPGLLLVACGYAFVPQHYKRAIATGIYATLIFPALYVAWAFYAQRTEAMFAPREIVRLGTAVAIHGTTVAVLILAAHWLWALQRKVFESRTIGRYKVQERIGRGGMGEVWRAWDQTLKREVALKVLRTDRQDPIAVARFEREVRATTELTHPNTVRVFDFGATDDGISYYAMELLRGEPLSSVMQRERKLDPARATWFSLQVARALAEAHARGIVHRDIKPENIFITHAGDEGDHAKVLDFGIAHMMSGMEGGLTETGIVGTPQYIAPELLLGEKARSTADVYALGVVLFQMLTGESPFAAEDGRALLLARIAMDPRAVRDFAPEVPEPLAEVVRVALARAPEERFAHGRALADALKATGLTDGYLPAIAAATPNAIPRAFA
jgi:hypothetical protein